MPAISTDPKHMTSMLGPSILTANQSNISSNDIKCGDIPCWLLRSRILGYSVRKLHDVDLNAKTLSIPLSQAIISQPMDPAFFRLSYDISVATSAESLLPKHWLLGSIWKNLSFFSIYEWQCPDFRVFIMIDIGCIDHVGIEVWCIHRLLEALS